LEGSRQEAALKNTKDSAKVLFVLLFPHTCAIPPGLLRIQQWSEKILLFDEEKERIIQELRKKFSL
jgi:hypothetical protein